MNKKLLVITGALALLVLSGGLWIRDKAILRAAVLHRQEDLKAMKALVNPQARIDLEKGRVLLRSPQLRPVIRIALASSMVQVYEALDRQHSANTQATPAPSKDALNEALAVLEKPRAEAAKFLTSLPPTHPLAAAKPGRALPAYFDLPGAPLACSPEELADLTKTFPAAFLVSHNVPIRELGALARLMEQSKLLHKLAGPGTTPLPREAHLYFDFLALRDRAFLEQDSTRKAMGQAMSQLQPVLSPKDPRAAFERFFAIADAHPGCLMVESPELAAYITRQVQMAHGSLALNRVAGQISLDGSSAPSRLLMTSVVLGREAQPERYLFTHNLNITQAGQVLTVNERGAALARIARPAVAKSLKRAPAAAVAAPVGLPLAQLGWGAVVATFGSDSHLNEVLLVQLDQGSAWSRMGLKPGDAIETIDGHVVANAAELATILRKLKSRQPVNLRVHRDRGLFDLKVAAQ